MSVNRRFVLKGMALSGMAGVALAGPGQALAALAPAAGPLDPVETRKPDLVLVNGGPAEAAFLHGAHHGSGARIPVARASDDLGFLLEWQRRLGRGQGERVIGLLDDASAGLVLDLARSAGARVQWLGQHTASHGLTRHRLLNTDLSRGCARQLSRQLHACGMGFSINEERLGELARPRWLDSARRSGKQSDQWVASIGLLLGALGNEPVAALPRASAATAAVNGSFVSFSIEA